MSEGEFKKIIQRSAVIGNTREEMEHEVFLKLVKTLDDARKEFPQFGIGDTIENAAVDAINKITAWKEKWFGTV